MSRHLLSRAIRVGALALMFVVVFADAGAQTRPAGGFIEGVVTDTSLAPLAEATVSMLGSSVHVVTGANGKFRISDIAPGQVIVLVRRVGFEPLSARVLVTTLDTARMSFAMERATTTLGTVVIAGKRLSMAMTEFEEHRKLGVGQFMTQVQIEKWNMVELSDLLATFTGGKRGAISRMAGCAGPVVFIDGVRMPQTASINDIAIPKELAGIEFYSGPAQTPLQYKTISGGSCGVILLWTRVGT